MGALKLVAFPAESRRPSETDTVLAGLRRELEQACGMLRSAESTIAEIRKAVDRVSLMALAEQWDLGNGWLTHITPLYTDAYYRSRRSVDGAYARMGLGDLEFTVGWRVYKDVAPAITHDQPFVIRVQRPSGEIIDGPIVLSVPRYRKLRTVARRARQEQP